MVKRISTGIPGLDPLVEGGFIDGSVILLTGGTGTGKNIFSLQFLWHWLQKGESGVYITLEENPTDIKEDGLEFGWDFEKFEKRGLFKIVYHDPAQVNNLGSVIIDEIERLKAKRIVIDSTSVIALNMESHSQVRKFLYNIINTIKRTGCTGILTSEVPEGSQSLTRFGVEEFVVDGVIILNYLGTVGEYVRSLQIRKMRRTDHGKDVYPLDITHKGIIIKSES